jgi:mannobiose 2-epimerase
MKFEAELVKLKEALYTELNSQILPYWKQRVYSSSFDTFNGRIDALNQVHPESDRSAILITRIAYTFAAAYKQTSDPTLLVPMHAAVGKLFDDFNDPTNGGLYWMTDSSGAVIDSKKHVYAQSFGIYAYATVFDATGDKSILDRAIELFNLIEKHAFITQSDAYYEAFTREWKPLDDVRLGESDLFAPRSTNTHLHLLEAYAALYKVWPDQVLKDRLTMLLEVFLDKIYNPKGAHFYAFFDNNWSPISTVYSFGHDIETVWLMLDAAQAVSRTDLVVRCEQITVEVSNMVLAHGIDDQYGGLFNAGQDGVVTDTEKHWWAQAEAMVGLMFAYKLTGNYEYLGATLSLWDFISNHVIDKKHGEWHFRVNREGTPLLSDDKVGPWKCPYHTSRACILVYSILNELSTTEVNSEVVQR